MLILFFIFYFLVLYTKKFLLFFINQGFFSDLLNVSFIIFIMLHFDNERILQKITLLFF